MTDTVYLVSADHAVPAYRFADTLVRVTESRDGFHATHAKLGCSKTYRTAQDAIRGMFADHACRVTAVRAAADQFNALYVYRNGGELVELSRAAAAAADERLSGRDVENLKGDSRFHHAGALAAALGDSGSYGCHYGMRSTRAAAMAAFAAGYCEAANDIAAAAR